MHFMHLNPNDALLAYRALGARYIAGVHWGAFDVTDEHLDQPPKQLINDAASLGIDQGALWLFALGETRVIP